MKLPLIKYQNLNQKSKKMLGLRDAKLALSALTSETILILQISWREEKECYQNTSFKILKKITITKEII